MSDRSVQVAIAFIHQGDRLLFQLRDDKPDIHHPNHWGLFGGSVDPGETPLQAVKRELQEELGWEPPEPDYLLTWEEPGKPWAICVFAVPLTVPVEQLNLMEGQALRLFTLDELTQVLVVPKIQHILPRAIELIGSPALTAAYAALAS